MFSLRTIWLLHKPLVVTLHVDSYFTSYDILSASRVWSSRPPGHGEHLTRSQARELVTLNILQASNELQLSPFEDLLGLIQTY